MIQVHLFVLPSTRRHDTCAPSASARTVADSTASLPSHAVPVQDIVTRNTAKAGLMLDELVKEGVVQSFDPAEVSGRAAPRAIIQPMHGAAN